MIRKIKMIPDWIKVAAMSSSELADEILKTIDELGGEDAAQKALNEYEGPSKKAGWAVEDIYVKAEGEEGWTPLAEEVVEEKPELLEKKPADGSQCQKCGKECYPGAMYCRECALEVFPKEQEPIYTPTPKEEASGGRFNRTMYLSTLLAAYLAGMTGGIVGPDFIKRVDLHKLINQIKRIKHTPVKHKAPKVAPIPEKIPEQKMEERESFPWGKYESKEEAREELASIVKAWQRKIDSIQNRALQAIEQKNLDNYIRDSAEK
jgi:hypothetical protein